MMGSAMVELHLDLGDSFALSAAITERSHGFPARPFGIELAIDKGLKTGASWQSISRSA
jgi:hypothetical protein